MEIVDFSDKYFEEIPKQDNPSFMTVKEWKSVGQDGCLMIVKRNNFQVVVIKISPVENSMDENSTVTPLGIFWEWRYAYDFCKCIK